MHLSKHFTFLYTSNPSEARRLQKWKHAGVQADANGYFRSGSANDTWLSCAQTVICYVVL